MYHPAQYQAQARIKMKEDLRRSELWRQQQRINKQRRQKLWSRTQNWVSSALQFARYALTARRTVQKRRQRPSRQARPQTGIADSQTPAG